MYTNNDEHLTPTYIFVTNAILYNFMLNVYQLRLGKGLNTSVF